MTSSKLQHKSALPGLGKAKRDHNWLGLDRERAVAHLQNDMAHTSDGVQKTLLAREARKVRHGTSQIFGAVKTTFSIPFSAFKNHIAIGVH